MTTLLQSTPLGLNEVYPLPTQDGSDTLFNVRLGCSYHSVYGAVAESRHVFIQHGLQTLIGKSTLNILELGFGTGLNAFLAYLFALKQDISITYTGIEAFPIKPEVAAKLDYPGYLLAREEADIFYRMHEMETFRTTNFVFRRLMDWKLLSAGEEFDCIFFDAFHPVIQPELWTEDIFIDLYRITAPGGCLVTYCAQGEVRRSMQKAGYTVFREEGAPGKREMLRALKVNKEDEVLLP
jgi:tRNA U34 5-methylaminomethyl-2-thiouridine-forming methyltransferase MnmC